jgi:hypothetical protein
MTGRQRFFWAIVQRASRNSLMAETATQAASFAPWGMRAT